MIRLWPPCLAWKCEACVDWQEWFNLQVLPRPAGEVVPDVEIRTLSELVQVLKNFEGMSE